MISATAIPTTLARFADSLSFVNIDFSRYLRTSRIEDEALKNAYGQFIAAYGNQVDERFDEHFLANAGAGIIDAFTYGEMNRHDAARALAQAWNDQLAPVSAAARKRRVLDATLAADSLLRWLDVEITGKPAVAEAPVEATAETAAEATVERLTLDVQFDDGPESGATIVAQGVLDGKNYHKFVTQAQQLYRQGVRGVNLDLSKMTKVDLSGIYALHATAKIFHGEHYPRHEYGYAGLRHMVEENLDAGIHPHVRLTAINERILNRLEQSGVAQVFGLQ